MNTSSHRVIATRQLSYKTRGDSTLRELTVCISEPYLAEGAVDIPVAEGAAACSVSFDGLPEKGHEVIGGDTFQALELAVSYAESALRRFGKKYEFYFDGEPYFDD